MNLRMLSLKELKLAEFRLQRCGLHQKLTHLVCVKQSWVSLILVNVSYRYTFNSDISFVCSSRQVVDGFTFRQNCIHQHCSFLYSFETRSIELIQGGHRSWNFQKSCKTHRILFGLEKVIENALFMKKPWKVMEPFYHVHSFFFSGELCV